jgi:5-methylcytosine-specific restriction protein A
MSLDHFSDRQAVVAAIEEYDRLGREAFHKKYGFGPATKYMLRYDGKFYDSKAILGVAHGIQFPAEGPLLSSEFHGGKPTTTKLKDLGFDIEVIG